MKTLRLSSLWAVLGVLLWVGTAWAVQPDEILDDPALEQRARDLSKELRCLVCRNESIDDSNASLAKDLRLLVQYTDRHAREHLPERLETMGE